jgi:hypothetical protein
MYYIYRWAPVDVVREQSLQAMRILDDKVLQLVSFLLDAPPRQGDRHREAAQAPGPDTEGPAAEDTVERQARELGAAGEEAVERGGGGDPGEAEGELGEVGQEDFASSAGGILGEAAVGELSGAEGAAGE